jgi:hypothetical protein
VIGAGLGLAAVGLAVLTQVGGSPDADLRILVGASLLVSLGLAPVFGSTTDLIVSSAPPERAGAASGISETGAELGGALGIAILGSIGMAVYRAELAASLPAGIPAEAEPGEQPAPEPVAAIPPEPEPQPEPAIQIIRAGSGCLACPGERSFSQADGAS